MHRAYHKKHQHIHQSSDQVARYHQNQPSKREIAMRLFNWRASNAEQRASTVGICYDERTIIARIRSADQDSISRPGGRCW